MLQQKQQAMFRSILLKVTREACAHLVGDRLYKHFNS